MNENVEWEIKKDLFCQKLFVVVFKMNPRVYSKRGQQMYVARSGKMWKISEA